MGLWFGGIVEPNWKQIFKTLATWEEQSIKTDWTYLHTWLAQAAINIVEFMQGRGQIIEDYESRMSNVNYRTSEEDSQKEALVELGIDPKHFALVKRRLVNMGKRGVL